MTFEYEVDGKRKKGRQKISWKTQFEEESREDTFYQSNGIVVLIANGMMLILTPSCFMGTTGYYGYYWKLCILLDTMDTMYTTGYYVYYWMLWTLLDTMDTTGYNGY